MKSVARRRRKGPLIRLLGRWALRAGRLWEALGRRPLGLAAILLAPTLLLGFGLPRLVVDNRIEVWTAGGEEEVAADGFSHRDFIVLHRSGVDPHAPAFPEEDRALSLALQDLPGVEGVESISLVLDRLGKAGLGSLGDGEKFFEGTFLAGTPAAGGGRTVITRVWLVPGAERVRVVAAVKDLLAARRLPAVLLGPAVFNAVLDERSRTESARVFPLALLAAAAILAVLYRSPAAALVLLGSAILGVLWFLGAAGWAGVAFNFVTVNVPAIALVVAITLTIHPLNAWRALRRPSLKRAAARAFPGCALSSLTTAGGFLTVMVGSVPAVRDFGLLAALAVGISSLGVFLSFPLVTRILGRPARAPDGSRHAPSAGRPAPARRLPRFALSALLAVVLAASLLGALRIRVDHDPLDFLSREDPVREEYRSLGRVVDGLAPLEFVVDLPEPAWTPSGLRLLGKTAESLARAAGTARSFSLVEPVKLAASVLAGGAPGSYQLPAADGALALAVLAVRSAWIGSRASARAASAAVEQLADPSGRRCRIFIPLNPIGGREFREVRGRLEQSLSAMAGVTGRATGLIDRLMRVQDQVLFNQASSLALGVAGVSVFLGAVLGTRFQASAALVANLLPLAIAAAVMGLCDLPLDLSTAMVGGVALGMGVDDTAHLLWTHRALAHLPLARRREGWARVEPAIVASSLVLAAGFAALGLARFPPIRHFGLLTALTLILALLSHLVVLPALLEREARPDRRPERGGLPKEILRC